MAQSRNQNVAGPVEVAEGTRNDRPEHYVLTLSTACKPTQPHTHPAALVQNWALHPVVSHRKVVHETRTTPLEGISAALVLMHITLGAP